jgi:hypothetical protein
MKLNARVHGGRVLIASAFGKLTLIVTDGHLSFPYRRELTSYEVADLPVTLEKARAAGATVFVAPFRADGRDAAVVQFPGGHIAGDPLRIAALE